MSVYTWIEQHHGSFAVLTMCRLLGVSRAAFYAWAKDPLRVRDDFRKRLLETIEQVRVEPFMSTYGSPRMTHELRARGVSV